MRAMRALRSRQRSSAGDTPLGRAGLATIEATASQDEDRWHEALALAVEHGLRLIGVDALEGLAVAAAAAEAWVECLRLAAAAARLRNETGYRWRFPFEQDRLDAAITAATEALGRRRRAPRPPKVRCWTGMRPPLRVALAVSGSGRATAGPR